MKKIKVWYKIEHHNKLWTVWKYKEGEHSFGSLGIYTASKKEDCIEYCKQNKITLNRKENIK